MYWILALITEVIVMILWVVLGVVLLVVYENDLDFDDYVTPYLVIGIILLVFSGLLFPLIWLLIFGGVLYFVLKDNKKLKDLKNKLN